MYLNPCSKINLGLYVTRRREDGYHDLQTCFYPLPLCDNLEVSSSPALPTPWAFQGAGRTVEGAVEDNLVVRAFNLLKAEFPDLPPTELYLFKRIPSGAGLGGGSSDAAFTLRALNDLYDLGLSTADLELRAARLGADCAFFVQAKPCLAEGIGNVFSPLPLSLKGWELTLVKPSDFVSTREAYAHVRPRPIDNNESGRRNLREALLAPVETWRGSVSNDFEESVFPQHPRIEAIKETLYDMGATYASMSGSGSSVYGLFRHRPTSAAKVFTDCFVYQARLLA